VIAGSHAALPHSLSCDHSMNQTADGERTGVIVYKQLLDLQKAGKKVYVFASHSHYKLENIFDTDYWRNNGGVLPGWIVGTAGAQRYRLPDTAAGMPVIELQRRLHRRVWVSLPFTDACAPLLEPVDGGIAAVPVVAHVRLGHGATHRIGGRCDGIGSKVDRAIHCPGV